MPFLNPPDVLPEAMRFIVRVVLARGGSLPEEELFRLVAPLGLTEAVAGDGLEDVSDSHAEPNLKLGGRTIAEKSLAALRGARLVDQKRSGDRSVSVAPAIEKRFASWQLVTAPAFASFLCSAALASASGVADVEDESGGADDLAAALALLFLMPTPLEPIATFEAGGGKSLFEYQTEQFGDDIANWVVRNRERYSSLVRWVTYLEFGRILNGGLVADPSGALRSFALPLLDEELPIADFLDRLGHVMPYSDRGTVGAAVRNRLSASPAKGEVTPGIALGLRVLDLRQHLRLSLKSDAASMGFPVDPDRDLRFSHISPAEAP